MRLLLNIIWMIFGAGLVLALHYLVGGFVLCLTVVGIPFGLQCFKLAHLSLFPFGKEIEEDRSSVASGGLGLVMNVVWIIFGGLSLFIAHVALGVTLALTIIGIPFAFQHLKLGMLALFPFGHRIVEAP